MHAIRSKGMQPELAGRRLVHSLGYRCTGFTAGAFRECLILFFPDGGR